MSIEQQYGIQVSNNATLWSDNALTPYLEPALITVKDMVLTRFDVLERNAVNTFQQSCCKLNGPTWSFQSWQAQEFINCQPLAHERHVHRYAGWVDSNTLVVREIEVGAKWPASYAILTIAEAEPTRAIFTVNSSFFGLIRVTLESKSALVV